LYPTLKKPEACHIASITPETCKCTHSYYLSKTIVYTDGGIVLDTSAMELNFLLYLNYGDDALNEVTIVLDPIFASVDDAFCDIANIKILVLELDSLFDILVFKADLQDDMANQSSTELISDSDCNSSFVTPSSLPTASEAPNVEAILSSSTGLKPRPPLSPNLMVLDIPRLSEITRKF